MAGTEMSEALVFLRDIAFFAVFGYLFIAFLVYAMIVAISRPDKMFPPVTRPKSRSRVEQVRLRWSGWDTDHGFIYAGNAQGNGFIVAFWEHVDEPVYFTVYAKSNGTESYEFETFFESPGLLLSTTNTPEAMLLPSPADVYREAFPGAYIEDLWDQHKRSTAFLEGRLQKRSRDKLRGAHEMMCEHARIHMQYVRSLPLWPLRWGYWFFVRRNSWQNRSIEDQFASRKSRFIDSAIDSIDGADEP